MKMGKLDWKCPMVPWAGWFPGYLSVGVRMKPGMEGGIAKVGSYPI